MVNTKTAKAARFAAFTAAGFCVGLVGIGITTASDNRSVESVLASIGITPAPTVCEGCAVEQDAYNQAGISLAAAVLALEDAEQDLIACQQGQGGGGSGSAGTDDDLGPSVLVQE